MSAIAIKGGGEVGISAAESESILLWALSRDKFSFSNLLERARVAHLCGCVSKHQSSEGIIAQESWW